MFIIFPILKNGSAQESSNYHTMILISHVSKVMLKNPSSQSSAQCELRNSRYTSWVSKRQRNKRSSCQHWWIIERAREFQKNIYFCFIDYAKAFDCVDHKRLWTILKEMGISDHLTCVLRNLYARQEAIVRTGHRIIHWFKIEKGVTRLYIVTCLLNFYAEYIMRNAGLDEAQAAIKIAGRNISNLRYADDTTLTAESEEELNSLL